MKNIFTVLLFLTSLSSCKKETTGHNTPAPALVTLPVVAGSAETKHFTYLALGDSYTIGHSVPPQDNYPNQIIRLSKNDNLIGGVKIIATTGWTTVDLKRGIEADKTLLPKYDMVSLLIGVNDQYVGFDIEKYQPRFEELLKKAIALAGDSVQRVVVLSIPDWSVTPFAENRDRALISKEIDTYNAINKAVAENYGVHYVDITPWTREAAKDLSLLAPDLLHPSGKEYARWAAALEAIINTVLRK